jgi:hypothetical protein
MGPDERLRCHCPNLGAGCVSRATAEDMLCGICRRGCSAAAWIGDRPVGHATDLHIEFAMLYAVHPAQRRTAYWVMDRAMFDALAQAYGAGTSPAHLMGLPIRIDHGATLRLAHRADAISGVY